MLLGWIGAQVAIIRRRSFLQPVMAGVCATLIGLGANLHRHRQEGRAGPCGKTPTGRGAQRG
jgi:hypothetical protein